MPAISVGEEGAGEFAAGAVVCTADAGVCAAARFAWDAIANAIAKDAHPVSEDNFFKPDRKLRPSTFVFIVKILILLLRGQSQRTHLADFPTLSRIHR
jgi:hypothetical protein